MHLIGVLPFVDLVQVHLWLAIGLGILLARRWRKKWAAVCVATAAYAAATAAFAIVPFSPSAYIVVLFSLLIDRGAPPGSFLRWYSTGVVSLFVLVCGLPTAAVWLVSRRRAPRV